MPLMRAKLRVSNVAKAGADTEVINFHAVTASQYPEDGSDENNTYAKYSPSASLEIFIANPALAGKFAVGDEFYVDFTKVSG
jgi:hypothetical protein